MYFFIHCPLLCPPQLPTHVWPPCGIPKATQPTRFLKSKQHLILLSITTFLSLMGYSVSALSGEAKQRGQIWRLLKVLLTRDTVTVGDTITCC